MDVIACPRCSNAIATNKNTHKTMKNETTTIDLSPIDRMISFLTMRYAFRYNTVLSCTEYRLVRRRLGRARPYRRPRPHRAHRRTALAQVVQDVAARHGEPVAEPALATLRQQRCAAAHLASGLPQEYVLPSPAARRPEVGLHRQPHPFRPPSGDARHVAAATHQPRRVQPDIAACAAGFSEERYPAALDKGETTLWHAP